MNNKSKSIMVLLGTLVLGFVIGFFTNRILISEKIERFRQFAQPKGFPRFIERELDLTSEQKEKLKDLWEEFDKRNFEIREDIHVKIDSLMYWLKEGMDTVLTEEQKKIMKEKFDRRRKHLPFRGRGYQRGREERRVGGRESGY